MQRRRACGEVRERQPQAGECPEPPHAGKTHGGFSPRALGEHGPANTWILDFWLPGLCEKKNLCCVNPPSLFTRLWHFVTEAARNSYTLSHPSSRWWEDEVKSTPASGLDPTRSISNLPSRLHPRKCFASCLGLRGATGGPLRVFAHSESQ